MSALPFPADVKLGQLTAFLRTVHASGGKLQVAKASRELHTDLVMLLPIMDAAEMLQLAEVEKGEVKLLKHAEELLATPKSNFSSIKPLLRGIEPFKTAVALKRFTAEQIAGELARKGVRWHHEDTVNTMALREMMIHWGISSGLLDYDGYTSTFTVRSG